jgi:hypothetical protein
MKKRVIPEEWGHPILMRGEVEVRKIGGKKVVFPIRSFSRWANRALMNQVMPWGGPDAPFAYSHWQLKNPNGDLISPYCYENIYGYHATFAHFFNSIAVGDSAQAWSYDDYNLISLKDWAGNYSRRSDALEYDGYLKAEFQGSVQASSAYSIREVGLFGAFWRTAESHEKFLVSRDVLPSPISMEQSDVVVIFYRVTVGGT